MALHSRAGDPPACSLVQFVLGRIHEFGDRVALEEEWSGRRYTYSGLRSRVAQVASGLQRLGFGRGQLLCLYTANCLENVPLLFGALAAGGAVHLMLPLAPVDLVAPQLVHCEAQFLATTSDREHEVVAMLSSAGCRVNRLIVVPTDTDAEPAPFPHQRIPFAALIDEEMCWETLVAGVGGDELAVLQLSGGTTGMAKTIMTRHRNLVASQFQAEQLLDLAADGDETFLAFLPINHSYPINAIYCPALRIGGKVVVMRGFDPDAVIAAAEKHRATMLHVVPSQIRPLLRATRLGRADLSSVRQMMSGALTIHPEVHEEILRTFRGFNKDFDFRQAYGLTETSGAVTMIPPRSQRSTDKLGSVGVLLSQSQGRILRISRPTGDRVNTTADEVGVNQVGEVCVKGPQLMMGYLRQPEKTAEALSDGWLRTGDVGYFDSDGYMYVTDRLADVIWCEEEMILPSTLENVLSSHPLVDDYVVLGVPHPTLGQVPAAMVVTDSTTLTKQDLINFTNARVKGSVGLKHVVFVDSIKKTPVGKPFRAALRKEIEGLLS